ncbi:hypothetical protein LP419_37025 [Massilia sp. H-1]|nr:hypothetical protein LP419_37025 [Massilia sp. H-1]
MALIHTVRPGTTFKAIHGLAFRAPNAFERFYAYPGSAWPAAQSGPDARTDRLERTGAGAAAGRARTHHRHRVSQQRERPGDPGEHARRARDALRKRRTDRSARRRIRIRAALDRRRPAAHQLQLPAGPAAAAAAAARSMRHPIWPS